MLLIVTNKKDEHADGVIEVMNKRNIKFLRVNTQDFPQRIVGSASIEGNRFCSSLQLRLGRHVDFSQVSAVWYRRPLPPVVDSDITEPGYAQYALDQSEAFIKGLWQANSKALWVNHPLANRAAGYKVNQLRVASELGFNLPNTLITNSAEQALQFYNKENGQVVVKPLYLLNLGVTDAMGLRVISTRLLQSDEVGLIESISLAPSILQTYVDKEFELRITVMGKKVFAVALDSQSTQHGQIDWRLSLHCEDLPHRPFDLPDEIGQKCLALTEYFGLNFGAIDLIVKPDGTYVFLEINPNGQWIWMDTLTGLPMIDTMIELLTNGDG
jgi:glutathione synthase/RimK-type ligase-like ATP-grasp enzyme